MCVYIMYLYYIYIYISYNVHTRAHVNVHAISTFQMNWLHGMGRSIATFDYQRISICKSHQQSAFVSTVFLVASRLKVRVACDASAKTGHPKTYRLIMSCWKVEYCIGLSEILQETNGKTSKYQGFLMFFHLFQSSYSERVVAK